MVLILRLLKKCITELLFYILPPKCPSCTTNVTDMHAFCAPCWSDLNFITKPFCNICGKTLPFTVKQETNCLQCYHNPPIYQHARAILNFDEKSKKLIHYFKYYDKTSLAKIFANTLYTLYSDEINKCDIIISVPMHKLKRMLRFYNHAFVLAQEIAKISNKPLHGDILIKTKWTKSQAKLSKKQRDRNLYGSFEIKNQALIANKKVILVDDVLTTGSTISICTKELKKYAHSVLVLCVAFTHLR